MVIEKSDFEKFPICDTNILINFGLENILDKFVEFKNKIFISDCVYDELDRKFEKSRTYNYLLKNVNENDSIVKIERDKHFNQEQIWVMNANLNEFEIKNDTLLTGKLCPNAGEFISAIYAANLGIRLFITHDIKFINKYEKEPAFQNLTFRNMIQTLDGFIGKDERKKFIVKWKDKNKDMEEDLNQEILIKKCEKWKLKIGN